MTTVLDRAAREIIAAAVKRNDGEGDEALSDVELSAINAGEAIIDVALLLADSCGGTIRAIVTKGVVASDGGFWEADEPVVKYLRVFDGRLSREDTARRASRYLGVAGAKVRVRYRTVGL